MSDETDVEAILCDRCGSCLNGKPLWILADSLETLCESCYVLERLDETEAL